MEEQDARVEGQSPLGAALLATLEDTGGEGVHGWGAAREAGSASVQ